MSPTPTMSRRYADVVHCQGERPGVRDIVRTLTLLAHEEVFLGRSADCRLLWFRHRLPGTRCDHVKTATVASPFPVRDIAFRCECVASEYTPRRIAMFSASNTNVRQISPTEHTGHSWR